MHVNLISAKGLAIAATIGVATWAITRTQSILEDKETSGKSLKEANYGIKSSGSRMVSRPEMTSRNTVASEIIPQNLDPLQASLLFDQFKTKHPGNRERIAFARAIIGKLCELGYTQEAWDMIEAGEGDVRNNQLISFFASAKLSDEELLEKIAGSPLEDIHVSISGFMERFKPEEYEHALRSPDFRKFIQGVNRMDSREAKIIKSSVSSGLGSMISISLYEHPNKTHHLLDMAGRLNADGLLETSRFLEIVARFGRGTPFESWSLISNIKSEGDDFADHQRKNLIRNMIEADAQKALSKVLESNNSAKLSDVQNAVELWVGMDSRGATDWFLKERFTLKPEDSDAIAAAFSSHAADLSEFSSAKQWAEQIQDSNLKSKMLQEIAGRASSN